MLVDQFESIAAASAIADDADIAKTDGSRSEPKK